jgi:MFS family permease
VVDKIITKPTRRRIVGSLFGAQSLFSAAIIISFTLTSIISVDLSGNENVAGLPSTVTLISRAALAYPIGWLLDRLGRRMGLSIGYLIGVTGALISAWSVISGSFLGFLAGAALIGGSRAASEQTRYVAAEVFPSQSQSKVIGWIVFAGTIGAILGPILVGPATLMAENLGQVAYAGPFIVAGLMLLIAGLVTFALLRPDPQEIGQAITAFERGERHEDDLLEEKARPLRQIFGNSYAILAIAAMTIGQLVMVMLMVITPVHMNHHDHGTQAISWIIMAHTLGMFGLSGLTGWLIGRFGRLTMIAAGACILIMACFLAPVSTDLPLLALSLFLLGLGWNFTFVAGSSLLSAQLFPIERGRAQGAGEMSVAVGAGLGSLASGVIFARGDILAVSIIGLAFSLALVGMVLWVWIAGRPVKVFATGQD